MDSKIDHCIEPRSFTFSGDGKHAPTNWTKGIQIGCGGFSEVYLASLEFREKFNMVVKQIKIGLPHKENKKYEDSVRTEITALKKLVHERIVSFYGFCSTKFAFFIFMEHMQAGSLSNYISENGALCLHLVKQFTRQLLEGVEYLHSQRIIHRDIKPDNILMKDNKNIKIADFGVSKIFEEVSKAYTSDVGTTRYMAPEMFRDGGYKYPVDIWSCGCVVLEMTTGKSPFSTLSKQQIYSILMTEMPSPIQSKLPKNVSGFLKNIFKKEPEDRPMAKDLLLDIFLQDSNSQKVIAAVIMKLQTLETSLINSNNEYDTELQELFRSIKYRTKYHPYNDVNREHTVSIERLQDLRDNINPSSTDSSTIPHKNTPNIQLPLEPEDVEEKVVNWLNRNKLHEERTDSEQASLYGFIYTKTPMLQSVHYGITEEN